MEKTMYNLKVKILFFKKAFKIPFYSSFISYQLLKELAYFGYWFC